MSINRSEFLRLTCNWACASCVALVFGREAAAEATTAATSPTPVDEALKTARYENEFTNNWLTDLFATLDAEVDEATRLKIIEGCGRGCYRRHAWKHAIVEEGRGDVDKLVAAYRNGAFKDTVREGDDVHIRYHGGFCYCPAAKHRPVRPHDLQCECTRANHQAMWEEALGRKFRAEVVESVRRGGQVCHIVIHLA